MMDQVTEFLPSMGETRSKFQASISGIWGVGHQMEETSPLHFSLSRFQIKD